MLGTELLNAASNGIAVLGQGSSALLRDSRVAGCRGHGLLAADSAAVSGWGCWLQENSGCGLVVRGKGGSAELTDCDLGANAASGLQVQKRDSAGSGLVHR